MLTNNGTTVDYTADRRIHRGRRHLHLHGERRDVHDSNVATVTVTVTGVNDAPVAVDDSDKVDRGRYSCTALDLLVQRHGRSGCGGPADDHECGCDVGPGRLADEQRHDRGLRGTCRIIVGDDTFTYTANDGTARLQRGDGDDHGDGRERRPGGRR